MQPIGEGLETILLLDESLDLASSLSEHGYNVISHSDASCAISAIQEGQVDLALIGLSQEPTIIDSMKASHIPSIIISSDVSPDLDRIAQYIKSGADECIIRPEKDISPLIKKIDHLLEKKQVSGGRLQSILDRDIYSDQDRRRIRSVIQDLSRIRRRNEKEMYQRYSSIAADQAQRALLGVVDRYCPFILNHIEDGIRQIGEMCDDLRVPMKKRTDIKVGYMFHDIGKLFTPQNILSKKDTLSSDEKKIVHLHPGDSYRILHYMGWKAAADIVRYHHSSPDHKGYPAVKNVCIGPQMISVVDSFFGPQQETPYRMKAAVGESYTEFIEKAVEGRFYKDIACRYDDLLRQDFPVLRKRKSYKDQFNGRVFRGKNA